MTEPTDNQAVTPLDVDRAAERLLSAIDATCDPAADFSAQLGAALEAALGLLAAEPALIRPLTDRFASGASLARQRSCRASCAARLRETAARATGREEQPPYVEAFLVAAIQFQVSRALREGETDLLLDSITDLRDFMLVYYRGPA